MFFKRDTIYCLTAGLNSCYKRSTGDFVKLVSSLNNLNEQQADLKHLIYQSHGDNSEHSEAVFFETCEYSKTLL